MKKFFFLFFNYVKTTEFINMGLWPYDAELFVDGHRLLFFGLHIPFPILFLISFNPHMFPPIKPTNMSVTVAMKTYVVIEVKTSIGTLHDFWQGKIVWVGVSITLVNAHAAASLGSHLQLDWHQHRVTTYEQFRHKHRWFSGRMLPCHVVDPGSILGRWYFFFTLCKLNFVYQKANIIIFFNSRCSNYKLNW